MNADLKIVEIKAFPTSFPLPPEKRVALGIGTAIKRDAVVVKVRAAGGLVGWGEAHHGRAHGAVAKLIETTLSQLVLGMDAADVVGVWAKIYKMQLRSHCMRVATCLAMSCGQLDDGAQPRRRCRRGFSLPESRDRKVGLRLELRQPKEKPLSPFSPVSLLPVRC